MALAAIVACRPWSSLASLLVALGGTGSASAQVARKHPFVASISLGTPLQHFQCLLDSGNADLWIPSKRCKSCSNEHFFRADKSSTFLHPEARMVTISYAGGRITGYDVQDTVQFGQAKVKNQSFIIVEDESLPAHRSWDGICGLGWASLKRAGGKPLYARFQEQGQRALFALVPVAQGEVSMHMGKVPASSYKSDTLVWAKAQPLEGEGRSFWVASGGIAIRKPKPAPVRLLVDTGTEEALLVPWKDYPSVVSSLLPKNASSDLCSTVGMSGEVVRCDCSITKAKLPSLRIYLGDRAFPLAATELFVKVPPKDTEDSGKEKCVLQVRPKPMAWGTHGPVGGLLGGLLGDITEPSTANESPLGGLLGGLFGPGAPGAAAAGAGSSGKATSGALGAGLLGGLLAQHPRNASSGSEAGSPGGLLGGLLGGSPGDSSNPAPKLGSVGLGGLAEGLLGTGSAAAAEVSGTGGVDSETEVVTQSAGNGTVCTTTLVKEKGKVRKNVTKCVTSKAAPAAEQKLAFGNPESEASFLERGSARRLQLGGLLGAGPMDDTWVLGAVFVERYVTAFDFDGARLGFAEPVVEIQPELRVLGLEEVHAAAIENHVEARGTSTASVAWASSVPLFVALGAAGWAARRLACRRTPQDLEPSSDLEAFE